MRHSIISYLKSCETQRNDVMSCDGDSYQRRYDLSDGNESSSSSASSTAKGRRDRKLDRKRKKRSTSSRRRKRHAKTVGVSRSSYDTDDSSSTSERSHQRKRKKLHESKEKRKKKKVRRKEKKRHKKSKKREHEKSNTDEGEKEEAIQPHPEHNTLNIPGESTRSQGSQAPEHAPTTSVLESPTESTRARLAPMSREEYEKEQSVVREVFDEESGRWRLVRGSGEIIERIVSRGDHQRINQRATQGDGSSFSKHINGALGRR